MSPPRNLPIQYTVLYCAMQDHRENSLVILNSTYNNIFYYIIQVASLALLLAAIGGSDKSVQYIFVIHVGMDQSEVYKLWIVSCRVVRSLEQHSVCGDDPSRTVMQQSTRYYFHFAFLHQCLHFNH